MPTLSIIIPTRRFDPGVRECATRAAACLPDAEIICVEPDDLPPAGSPADLPARVRLLRATRGRGTQCNRGAQAAAGDLLMFLHDDTELPADAASLIQSAFSDPRTDLACFRLRFDQRHWLLGVYSWCSRFESLLTTFGDQAMTIRRDRFAAIGGFPDWPLFEDVELARRVRRVGRITKLRGAVTTSASRFLANGMLRQQLANGLLMARFLLGAAPERLAARYERQAGARRSEDPRPAETRPGERPLRERQSDPVAPGGDT